MLSFELLATAWFFAFGAVIGSFLNVVVWRTPRGESIIGPSRCPQCKTAIRWYNNVPVFGWLWLGGKCRDCRLPISPRYPIVEFLCGAMFLAVALAELANRGFTNVMLDANWDLIRVYALHMLLLCALLAWALMQVDEQPIPLSQIASLWLIGFTAAVIWPPPATTLRAVDAAPLSSVSQAWSGFLSSLLGFLVGGCVASPLIVLSRWLADRGIASGERYWAIAVALASVGLFLGKEAAVVVALIAVGLRLVSLLAGIFFAPLRRAPLTMDIFAAAVAQICIGKWLTIAVWQ